MVSLKEEDSETRKKNGIAYVPVLPQKAVIWRLPIQTRASITEETEGNLGANVKCNNIKEIYFCSVGYA
jgi:hypothetical protein